MNRRFKKSMSRESLVLLGFLVLSGVLFLVGNFGGCVIVGLQRFFFYVKILGLAVVLIGYPSHLLFIFIRWVIYRVKTKKYFSIS